MKPFPFGTILGEFEQLVLLALLRLGNGAFGAAIHREIVTRTGRDFPRAGLRDSRPPGSQAHGLFVHRHADRAARRPPPQTLPPRHGRTACPRPRLPDLQRDDRRPSGRARGSDAADVAWRDTIENAPTYGLVSVQGVQEAEGREVWRFPRFSEFKEGRKVRRSDRERGACPQTLGRARPSLLGTRNRLLDDERRTRSGLTRKTLAASSNFRCERR